MCDVISRLEQENMEHYSKETMLLKKFVLQVHFVCDLYLNVGGDVL